MILRFFLITLLYCANSFVIKAQSDDHLFYCIQNQSVSAFYPLEGGQYLGVDFPYLLLFDENKLIIDSLKVPLKSGKSGDRIDEGNENDIIIHNNNYFTYKKTVYQALYKVAGNQIQIVKELKPTNAEQTIKFLTQRKVLLAEGEIQFSYKDVSSKKRLYKYSYTNAHQQNYQIAEFEAPASIKKSRYYLPKGAYVERYFTLSNQIFIPHLVDATLYIFDIQTQKTKKLVFPVEQKDKDSWVFYVDYMTQKIYALHSYKNNRHQLYELNPAQQKYYFIKNLSFIPTHIIGNFMWQRKITKLKKGQLEICHYNYPIDEANKETVYSIEGVEIN